MTHPDLDHWITTLTPARQEETRRLIDLFHATTGWQPRLHRGGMVGFGQYAYAYDSGHSGTSFATGFAPRKAEISLYILQAGHEGHEALLARLGRHRSGKACLYLKHLSDADPEALRALITAGLHDLAARWPVTPT